MGADKVLAWFFGAFLLWGMAMSFLVEFGHRIGRRTERFRCCCGRCKP